MKVHWLKLGVLVSGVLVASGAVAQEKLALSTLWADSLEAETMDDLELAQQFNDQILTRSSRSFRANLRAGWLLYSQKEYKKALDYYDKAASVSSGAVNPLLGQMSCHWALGDLNDAVRAAKAVLMLDEMNYTASLSLAQIYYQGKEFSRAMAVYRKLNRLYPEDEAVISGLAWSYLETGWVKQAKPLFETLVKWSPDYPYAQKGLSICNR